jgi:hypothetical protein
MSIRLFGRSTKLALVAGIVTFSVLAGAGAGWAYWTSQATSTTSVQAATLSITSTGFAATTLGNESVTAAGAVSLASTGSITFTNTTTTTSTQTQTLGVTFSRASGDATLAAATTLTVWSVASAASCTAAATPTSPVSGTWSAGVSVSRTLAPGASAVYCVRNTVADRQGVAVAGGTRSFVPQAAATISVGAFAGATTPTSAIQTQYIYPLQAISTGIWWNVVRAGTTWCWDASGNGTASGTLLISYGCKNNADTNQDFRYIDGDGDGYGNFQPRHATALRIAAAASTASGSAVDFRTADANAAVQQWQPQLVSAGTYQFVNKYSGLCLSAPATSTGVLTQVTCTGGADQRFTLTERTAIQLTSFVCVDYGSGSGRSELFNRSSDWNGGGYTIQARKNGSTGAWTTIATAPAENATSASAASPIEAPFTSTGTYNIQILNSTGQVVGTETVTVSASYIWIFVLDYYYARC